MQDAGAATWGAAQDAASQVGQAVPDAWGPYMPFSDPTGGEAEAGDSGSRGPDPGGGYGAGASAGESDESVFDDMY